MNKGQKLLHVILTNPPLDYIFFLYPPYLQNFHKIKDQCYRINQIFKFQVFVVLNYQFSQKLKLLGYDKFNHLTTYF